MDALAGGRPGFWGTVVRWLRRAGFVDEAQLSARAFCRLEDELFRLPWVEGIVARGFAHPPDDHGPRKEAYVEVVSFERPDPGMRRDVDEAVGRVNRRFGTRLSVHVVEQGRLTAVLRPGARV